MKATRRTVLGWLLAAAICPPRLEIPKTLKELHAIRHADAIEGAFLNYRELVLKLYPDASPAFMKMLEKIKVSGECELDEMSFDWRPPNGR